MTRGLNRFEMLSLAAAAASAAVAGGLALASTGNTVVFVASGLALVTLAWIVGLATE